MSTALTQPQATHLQEHGWCVIPDALEATSLAQTRDALARAIQLSTERGNPTHVPTLDPNASNVRVFNLLDLDELFRELIAHPLAIDAVKRSIGEHFLISNFTANIARPGARSMQPHSDLAIVFPGPWLQCWSLNVIWCLDDVDEEVGATRYLPGSHRAANRDELPDDLLAGMQPFEARAGDVIVMDGRLWHTSGNNTSANRERALLFGYYSASFLRPQVNWNAALSAETQASIDPDLRRWLGLDAAANVAHASYVARTESQ